MKSALLMQPGADGRGRVLGVIAPSLHRLQRLSAWLLVTALIVGLTLSRRPDALLAARFRAEDGANWYADAYNVGALQALSIPYAGYLETLPRLVAALGMNLRLQDAPTLFNAVAIAIEVLPILFLLSGRLNQVIPDLRVRLIVVVVYVALPNSQETAMNLTNARWHLAILALMVGLSSPPASWRGRIFDVAALVTSGLTGPFAILLAPVLGIRLILRRERWILAYLAIDMAAVLVQLSVFALHASEQRRYAALGIDPGIALRLAAGQVWLPAHIGQGGTTALYMSPWWQPGLLEAVGLMGLLICLAAAALARLELRLVLLYAGLQYGSIFIIPQLVPNALALAQVPANNGRWYLIPTIAWLAVLFWAASRGRLASVGAMLLLCVTLSIGVIEDWQYQPYADLEWQAAAKRFDQASRGTVVEIPVNPPGWGVMTLRRK